MVLRRLLPAVLVLPLLVSAAAWAAQKPPAEKPAADPIVYVTKTGDRYHTATCRYLRQSKIPMKLSEAAKKYTPCSVCKPPVAQTTRSTQAGR